MNKTDQRWLPQKFRAPLIVVSRDRPAHHLSSANPSTDADQNDQVLVAVGLHRVFYFVLRRLQFFLARIPLIRFREVVDAVAATENVLADAERPSELDHIRANVFHLLAILCFHLADTVCCYPAKI